MCPMWRGTPLAEMDKLILRIIGPVYTPPLLALSTQGDAGSRTALINRVRLGIKAISVAGCIARSEMDRSWSHDAGTGSSARGECNGRCRSL